MKNQKINLLITDIGAMIVEDHRYISCGGDPFNYMKSVFKGLSIELDPGKEAEVMAMSEKFPYEKKVFEGLAATTKLKLQELKKEGDEIHIFLIKPLPSETNEV
ncbi:MAG: hypothetical protein ACYCP1_00585 [Thermoplasmataceae archaeon]